MRNKPTPSTQTLPTPTPKQNTISMIVGQGPTALAVGASGVDWTFYSHLCLLSSFGVVGWCNGAG